MSIRQAARRAAAVLAAASAAGAFSIAVLGAPAGATTPTEGSSVPNSAVPGGTFVAGGPFSSGQLINIVVPTNSVFTATASTNLNIEECAAPNGVIPTLPSACDGNTIQGPSLKVNSDGSINFQTETHSLYTVYALPDSLNLGETSGVPCGDTAATECILYIGQNQNDFTAPHVWSQPFFILANTDDGGENPSDGTGTQPPAQTPEVPLAIILPGAALALFGGTFVVRRRRQQQLEHQLENH
jgi:hypothetical protein